MRESLRGLLLSVLPFALLAITTSVDGVSDGVVHAQEGGRRICTQNSQCSAGRFCSQDGRCERRRITPSRPIYPPSCPTGQHWEPSAGACQPDHPWYDCSREQGAVASISQRIRDTCSPPEDSRQYVMPGHCPHLFLQLTRASDRLERCRELNPEGTGG